MRRQLRPRGVVMLFTVLTVVGCQPQQPFYFREDGDLSHYVGTATRIEYPDVETCSLDSVEGALEPLTLDNFKPESIEEISLEEAVQIALGHSKVMRNLGGVAFSSMGTQGVPQGLTSNPALARSVYGPALTETNPQAGVEAALSAFDTRFTTNVFWNKTDRPQNVAGFVSAFRPRAYVQDYGTFQSQLQKTAATGTTFGLAHNIFYEWNNASASRLWPSDWNTNVEAMFRHPWLRGGGIEFNRIAGPGAVPGVNNGVMIARLRMDTSLADFEMSVRELVKNVETAYWNLYFAYRLLDAAVAGRDSTLKTWRDVDKRRAVGARGGSVADEALASQQFFAFRGAVEDAQSNLFKTENALRYVMGLAATDGRLLRPSDDPTSAPCLPNWHDIQGEMLTRSVELRKQKWVIKQRQLELTAAGNYVRPRLDSVALYRWLGMGQDLIDSSNATPNAYGDMTGGDFQEWQLGMELEIPIGYRRELAGVRYAQLNLARERAVYQDMELELSHQLTDARRDLAKYHKLSETYYSRRAAAEREVWAMEKASDGGTTSLDLLLNAQKRRAEAERDYYRALVDYNLSIMRLHYRKGSLLEYDGVYLSEGPWPRKAYFDACRRGRARDAAIFLDYGFTRPRVISQGTFPQEMDEPLNLDNSLREPIEPLPEVTPISAPWEPLSQGGSSRLRAEHADWFELSDSGPVGGCTPGALPASSGRVDPAPRREAEASGVRAAQFTEISVQDPSSSPRRLPPSPAARVDMESPALKSIDEISIDISPSGGRLPEGPELQRTPLLPRDWSRTITNWEASKLHQKPLYFEEVKLERYGHTCRPCLQPAVSAAHFFLSVPVLPYKMGLYPPRECIYTLGYYRPGSCAPYMLDPLPLSVRAGLMEAGVWTGMPFLIP